MIGLLLGGLGSAATAAGLGTLGAGLTAAGSFLGGAGGIPGAAGTAAGTASAGSPGLLSSLIQPVSENLGTDAAGFTTTVTPAATPGQQMLDDMVRQAQGGRQERGQGEQKKEQGGRKPPPIPVAPRPLPAPDPRSHGPIDFSALLEAVNNRAKLGV